MPPQGQGTSCVSMNTGFANVPESRHLMANATHPACVSEMPVACKALVSYKATD